jgi:Esterase-like activity of phytase
MTITFRPLCAALALACSALTAQAAPQLIAIGSLDGAGADFSGQSGALENGARGDLLGGLGSGLAWAGGSTFLSVPDRGPNAVAWNSAVDDTTSYIPRFHALNLALKALPDSSTGLPFTLTPSLVSTTLLYSRTPLTYGATVGGYAAVPALNAANRFYFSGRSDNFSPTSTSADINDARFDPEGIRLSANGLNVYVSDEYGPYVYIFNRATGQRVRTISLPAELAAAVKSAQGSVEISGNTVGRVANKGMEGLAISPDGTVLWGFMQSALAQDGGDGARVNRIIQVELATGKVKQFSYDNYLADTAKTYGSSEVLALNSHELLVLERDGKGRGDGSKAVVKRVYKVDLAGASDITGLRGETQLLPLAVKKTLFLDIVSSLTGHGWAAKQIPAKLEGMAFGPDIVVEGVVRHTLYIANDNDFLPVTADGLANPNQWFVFSFTDADLGGSLFTNQTLPQ